MNAISPTERISVQIRKILQDLYPPEEVKALTLMIWCDLLEMDSLDIYMGKDINLSASKSKQLENILARMLNYEPIQYIAGTAQFCGYTFKVEPGVLIPRPETAELVEMIVDTYAQQTSLKLLDIGTGSGCIAISLAKKLPHAKVTAWDVSDAALAVANSNNTVLQANVYIQRQDILGEIKATEKFDVIVSNPPYITADEKKDMHANVLEWEPELALFAPENDPLCFYKRIAVVGRDLLAEGGQLFFEINRMFGKDIVLLLEKLGYKEACVLQDFYRNDRFVKAKR